jgi:23S rRNA (uracil1939-C5)-methyltransferase
VARPLTSVLETAEVIDLAQDGRGVARIDGKTVFIDSALPGESVSLRRFKRRAQFDEAVLAQVLRASPDRVEPRCVHFGLCGGCTLQHLAPAAQLQAKQSQLLETLQRIGGVRPQRVLDPIQGPAWGYRRRARLGVKYVHKKQRVLAGFRERSSPYLADLQTCEVLTPALRTLPTQLADLVASLDLREQIPQVEVAVGDDQTALVFRVLAEPGEADRGKLQQFGTRLNAQIFLQTGGLATVRPLIPPALPLRYRVSSAAVSIEFKPTDFIQVNSLVNSAMVDQALRLLEVEPSDRVLELFCGLGNFTLPLARRCGTVVGVEGDADLLVRAAANARADNRENIEFFMQNLFEPGTFGSWDARSYDRVLLDPPRAGAQEVMERMSRWGPKRVVYISCHPGSLARDARILTQTQNFELLAAGVMDMFAHTTHVESIAVFGRRP